MSARHVRTDRVAIVTGASSGIGLELSRELSARGQPVLAIARRAERLEALSAEAKAAGKAPIHPMAVDLTADDAAAKIRDRAQALGGPAWLVNNAGYGSYGPVADLDAREQTRMIRLNCEAVVALTAAVLPDMLARRSGVVLNVASVAGFQATPFYSVYGASKAFVLTFTEGLREEVRGSGVTVTCLCPGPVDTEYWETAGLVAKGEKPPATLTGAECARFALASVEKDRAVAIPGRAYQVLSVATQVLPRALVRRAAARRGQDRLAAKQRSR